MKEKGLPLVGRWLIAFIFLMTGISKIMHPEMTIGYMMAYNMVWVKFFLVGAILIEVLGAVSLIVGFKVRPMSALLFLYLIPVTLVFHTKFSDPVQTIMFMKNLAIMGALLMTANFGAGPLSIDAWLKKRKSREEPAADAGDCCPQHAG